MFLKEKVTVSRCLKTDSVSATCCRSGLQKPYFLGMIIHLQETIYPLTSWWNKKKLDLKMLILEIEASQDKRHCLAILVGQDSPAKKNFIAFGNNNQNQVKELRLISWSKKSSYWLWTKTKLKNEMIPFYDVCWPFWITFLWHEPIWYFSASNALQKIKRYQLWPLRKKSNR